MMRRSAGDAGRERKEDGDSLGAEKMCDVKGSPGPGRGGGVRSGVEWMSGEAKQGQLNRGERR